MGKYKKRPVEIEAITFDELVEYGRNNGANIVEGMPWSFKYNGHSITHENDECYLIPTMEGTMKFGPTDMLITGVKGEIYPCKNDIFELTYEKDKERYQANMQYLYEQEIKDTERFVEYMKKKKEEGLIFTPPLEEDGLVIELPPDDEIDDDGNLVDDPSLEDLPIPTNLNEAIEALANQENLEFIQKCTEDEFIGQTHHGFGTGIRNGWGLWTGSVLAKWFNEKGIYHADDMSGIILTSCYRKGMGEDIDLEQQIKDTQNFWNEHNPDVNKGII